LLQAVDAASDENNLYYQGTLTTADVEQDPENHVSGYIAIIGRPNAGKSTIRADRSELGTAKAQTTRHRIPVMSISKPVRPVCISRPCILASRRPLLVASGLYAFICYHDLAT
jgi:GTP-binding protein Era